MPFNSFKSGVDVELFGATALFPCSISYLVISSTGIAQRDLSLQVEDSAKDAFKKTMPVYRQ